MNHSGSDNAPELPAENGPQPAASPDETVTIALEAEARGASQFLDRQNRPEVRAVYLGAPDMHLRAIHPGIVASSASEVKFGDFLRPRG